MVKLGYDKRKKVYRKSVGFVLKKGKKVQKFWALGPDKQKAEIIMLKALQEWATLKALGSSVWTSDALNAIDELKNTLYGKASPPSPQKKSSQKIPHKTTTLKPLTYFQSIDYYCQEVIPTLNISEQWKIDLKYRMSSIKEALDDLPLNSIKAEHLLKIVNHYKNRPKNKHTGKPIAPDTASHFIRTAKRLFDYLDKIEVWMMPKRFENIFKVSTSDFTPTRSERLKSRNGIQTFTIDELSVLYKNASHQLREWIVVALNIGATQKELTDLMRGECFLESAPPYIEKVRPKTSRGGEVIGRWLLWEETADILQSKLIPESEWEYKKNSGVYYYKHKNWDKWKIYEHQDEEIYQNNIKFNQKIKNEPKHETDGVFGQLVYINDNGVRIDNVSCSWFRVMEKSKTKVNNLSFKFLRKTGAKIISDIAGKDIGKVYLAHTAKDMIGKHYVPENYDILAKALAEMRVSLQPMFDSINN
ncbi:MAG: hypothetical protein K9L30_19320 [Desulfobacterales bacterium]|nr:hypothetical protein [Desulfobacterales bacterium]